MDGLGETLYVGSCDPRYGYSTVFGSVDGMLEIRQRDGCTYVGVWHVPPWLIDPFARASGRCMRTYRSRLFQLGDLNMLNARLIDHTCDVIWLQSCLLPRASRFSFSSARIFIIRSAIPLTSPSHCSLSSGLCRISDAIRAPWTGGFE